MIQLGLGNTFTGVEFLAANRMRGWAMEHLQKLFATKMDIFVTPSCPITAPPIPEGALVCGESNTPLFSTVMRYIFLVNLCGFPGMAMPIGYSSSDGMPISIHAMADHWNDDLLLRISHFIDKEVSQRQRPPAFVELAFQSR